MRRAFVIAVVPFMFAVPATARGWCQMTSCSRRPTPEEPCVIADGSSCFPLAWRRRCTSISLSAALPSSDLSADEVREIFRRSLQTWQSVDCGGGARTGIDVTVLSEENACTRAVHFTEGPNVHSVMFVPSGWTEERMHDPRAFAVTLVWHDVRSGEIWDVDMEINERRGPFGVCPETPEDACPPGLVDLQNVVTHELGHYFGIAHTPDDAAATMWAMAQENETHKRTLTADDVEAWCSIYPPGALPEVCDITPRGGLELACERRSGCGCVAPGMERATKRGSSLVLGVLALAIAALAARRRRTQRRAIER